MGKRTQLEIQDISISFGGIVALSHVNLQVYDGELAAIIGPNGAGKTTLFNCIFGIYRPDRGDILLDGKSLRNKKPHMIAKSGIARTFQNIELFMNMTVIENLMLGRHLHIGSGVFSGAFYIGRACNEEITNRRKAEEIIEFLEIEGARKKMVSSLPFGIQKRVELGRAMATDPKILLLDEPTAGMNVEEKEDMARFIIDIKEEMEITIIMVEHDMGVVMDLAERIMVLDFGRKIAEGSPDEIVSNRKVIQAYLGEENS